MGSFADGMKMGQSAYQMALNNQRRDEKDARERVLQTREDDLYARYQAQVKDEDEAVKNYGLLTTRGKANEPAIRANREANQAGLDAAINNITQGQPVAQPQYAPLQQEYTPASDLDKNQGLQAISRARRDWNGVASLQDKEKTINTDAGRKAEFKRLSTLKPDELASELGGEFSKDGSGVDAMLTYDPKANKFLFASNIPGMPSQSLSRAELMNYGLGVWEAGNGDIKAGMSALMGILKTKRETDNTNYTRAAGLATGNADLHFKGLNAQDAASRTAIVAGNAKTQRQRPTSLLEFVDSSGETVLLDQNQLKFRADGAAIIPAGLRPKTARSPDDTKAYREAMMTLGPRPAQRTGMFGGVDDKGSQQWDRQRDYVNQVFGRGQGQPPLSATDTIIAERQKGRQQAQPQEQGLSGLSNEQLVGLSRKPRGVSSAEAAEAQRELDNRQSGPPTLKAW